MPPGKDIGQVVQVPLVPRATGIAPDSIRPYLSFTANQIVTHASRITCSGISDPTWMMVAHLLERWCVPLCAWGRSLRNPLYPQLMLVKAKTEKKGCCEVMTKILGAHASANSILLLAHPLGPFSEEPECPVSCQNPCLLFVMCQFRQNSVC